MSALRPAPLLWGVAVLSFAGVAAAMVSQYQFGMLPCPWCTLQRLIFIVIGLLAAIGALLRPLRKPMAGLAILLSLSGVAAALWQHFVAAASESCSQTFADKLLMQSGLMGAFPSLFEPMASCADAAVDLLGVPYAFWSLALFVVLGAGCGLVLRTR